MTNLTPVKELPKSENNSFENIISIINKKIIAKQKNGYAQLEFIFPDTIKCGNRQNVLNTLTAAGYRYRKIIRGDYDKLLISWSSEREDLDDEE